MSELPAPMVRAEVDLRDFAFMPLDVQRLRDSDLASEETPEACWAAVLLWCASWHQVPAGSIPDSDDWQAKHAGYKSQGRIAPAWRKVRPGALRGWVACSDGRLYHPVIAEKANDAWRSKLRQRWGTECARIKKHNQRHSMSLPLPEFEAWLSSGCPQGQALPVPGDTQGMSPGSPDKNASKRQGEGQGQGIVNTETPSESSSPAAAVDCDRAAEKPERTPTIPCPYERIVALYHDALPGWPRVVVMSPARQKPMRKLWAWVLSSKRPDGTRRAETTEGALAWLADYFERAKANDFLMGRTPRSAEHANWRPDLDYLLTERGMRMVIEKTVEAA